MINKLVLSSTLHLSDPDFGKTWCPVLFLQNLFEQRKAPPDNEPPYIFRHWQTNQRIGTNTMKEYPCLLARLLDIKDPETGEFMDLTGHGYRKMGITHAYTLAGDDRTFIIEVMNKSRHKSLKSSLPYIPIRTSKSSMICFKILPPQ